MLSISRLPAPVRFLLSTTASARLRPFLSSRELHARAPSATPHVPVLLQEVLDAFDGVELKTFVDGTLGAAGHSTAVAKAHAELERLYGFDRDVTAHELARVNLATAMDVGPLVNLGVSSMQLDTDERGFSFMRDGPLNMRMDGSDEETAESAVNEWTESKLGQVIRDYGEERHWKAIARKIVQRRMEGRITTTQELVRAIGGKNVPGKKHPATKTFQALRIAVNGELDAVERVIPDAVEMLRPGGRLAIITFHSLEDRLVKWAFRKAAGMRAKDDETDPMMAMLNMPEEPREAKVKLVTRKPIKPRGEEEKANPRARSSKLRVVERLGSDQDLDQR
jgi:16S rRNA (cytosine1402-N4)-methyltransferase